MFRRILVSTDGSTHSSRAVRSAARLARKCGATLTIFHVNPPYRMPYIADGMAFAWPSETEYMKSTNRGSKRLLEKAQALAARNGIKARTMQTYNDDVSRSIISAAHKSKADLIVMASHGRKGVEKLILGSETQKVLSRTKLPVLVMR